jgi:alkylation response protein AidB-like acyl-CoA dehydrogenase
MDFELTEEQRAFQPLARHFARERMMPFARARGEDEIGGICVKDDVGGSALSRLDAAISFEELAQGCTSTTAYLSIHSMAACMLDTFGSTVQRRPRKLPPRPSRRPRSAGSGALHGGPQ